MARRLIVTTALCLYAVAAAAQTQVTRALVGATVIDVSDGGRASADLPDAVVLLRGSQIAAVGRRGSLAIPPGTQVVDVSGKFIVPGLVDGFAGVQSQAEANAQLYEGVTSVLATGDDRRGTLYLAADPSPHLYAIDSVGSTDDWSLLRNDPAWRDLLADGTAQHELTPAQTRAQLSEIGRRGIRAVWIGHNITAANTKAIVEQARQLHIATYGEFISTPYQVGLDAGTTTLLHMTRFELGLVPADPELATDPEGKAANRAYDAVDQVDPSGAVVKSYGDAIRISHVAIMPTFSLFYAALPEHRNLWKSPVAALFDPTRMEGTTDAATGELKFSKPGARAAVERMALHTFELDRALIARGVTVLAASGSTWQGTLPGLSMHTELELLVRAGLTPRAALAAATSNYADQFGWTELGKVEPGRRGDLLVLGGDPTLDIRAIDGIEQVWLAGERIDRDALLKH